MTSLYSRKYFLQLWEKDTRKAIFLDIFGEWTKNSVDAAACLQYDYNIEEGQRHVAAYSAAFCVPGSMSQHIRQCFVVPGSISQCVWLRYDGLTGIFDAYSMRLAGI